LDHLVLVANPLRVQVRDYIATRIVDGTFAPGDRLRELEIARLLGTSQTPVREALRDLSAMGFVDSEPNKGCRVRALNIDDLRQSHPVRAALEEIAGTAAAQSMRADIPYLRDELEQMRKAVKNAEIVALCFHSTRFHRHIVESAGNDALTRAWNALGIEILTLVGAANDERGLGASADEHEPIISALAAGDGDLAGRLLREHSCNYVASDPEATDVLCTN
jgi:DNA-binding GntR family transcriptional regulator